jgi:hypothetical protein
LDLSIRLSDAQREKPPKIGKERGIRGTREREEKKKHWEERDKRR